MKGKKVLITGGAGFIGSNLAERLVNEGVDVSVFVRSEENRENLREIINKINFIEGDITKEEDIKRAIIDKDYIFHLAWQTDLKKSMEQPKEDVKTDIIGLLNILENCRQENPNTKIIFPSTVTVIGDINKIPSNEDEKENPLSVYEINKLTAEKYLQMYYRIYGLKSVILRLANVFGEGQRIDNPRRGVLNFMIGRALRGEELTIYGEGEFIRDYTYVQDYIDAFILATESEKTNGEVYVLGSGRGIKFIDVVNMIKKIVEQLYNKKVAIKKVPFPEREHKINKRDFIADYKKFKEATGWYPKTSFEEGIKKTIKFYHNKEFK